MLGVGDNFPQMVVSVQQGTDALPGGETLDLGQTGGRWRVIFFWPRNFTSVCPTDVMAYGDLCDDLEQRDTDLIGASTDSVHMHLAWRKSDSRLGACDFPWIADEDGSLSKALGIFDPVESQARRATFIIDPEGIIQHASANNKFVGRNSKETLRILDALQSGDEIPCNWNPGDPVLNPSA